MEIPNQPKHHPFWRNFLAGIGWSFGVTFGFALIAFVFGYILHRLGGLPLIGNWLANLVEVTDKLLRQRGVF